MGDDLNALLHSRGWVERRVDRIEFLDLLTVQRTIVLTLDLAKLEQARSCGVVDPSALYPIPLGWFVPWANAGAELADADGRTIPYLTSAESDLLIADQIAGRLEAVGVSSALLRQVLRHRFDPGRPGGRCNRCTTAQPNAGYRELMSDKWGCTAVLELLAGLKDRCGVAPEPTKELVRILLAWQTNFVLFARLDASAVSGHRVTLRLSYDEELLAWEPPWERRRRVLERRDGDLSWRDGCECRRLVSRGGPFAEDLNLLAPGRVHGFLARRRSAPLRRLGRRGFLHVAWHVAWNQASGIDVADHHLDVVLPNELAVARMRLLQVRRGRRRATVADQVGSRATIVAPLPRGDGSEQEPSSWSPMLFSLTLTQSSSASWYGGAWLASLTGIALIAIALWRMPEVVAHVDAGIAVLVLAPALVSTVLAVRAASEIAEALTTTLRRLIGAVGALALACAVGLVVHRDPSEPGPIRRLLGAARPDPHLGALSVLWFGAGAVLLCVAAALFAGAWRIRRLLAFGRRSSPRYLRNVDEGEVLNPPRYPHVPPPDRWLNANEGDLVPWGWLHGRLTPAAAAPDVTDVDRSFWDDCPSCERDELVDWVREAIGYQDPSAAR
ncbi:MAG TPA: hypothetical protein VF250_05500 [Conexibacter sp.]